MSEEFERDVIRARGNGSLQYAMSWMYNADAEFVDASLQTALAEAADIAYEAWGEDYKVLSDVRFTTWQTPKNMDEGVCLGLFILARVDTELL